MIIAIDDKTNTEIAIVHILVSNKPKIIKIPNGPPILSTPTMMNR
jgi:hypothetical protein